MWESIALNKAKESAQLKEREVDNVTLVTRFTTHNQGGYQQRHLRPTQTQNQSNAVTGNQVTCWNCDIHGHISVTGMNRCPFSESGALGSEILILHSVV
ncbi:hypothetical protein NDA13_000118 [Ustilago tritici]|nr:hypothetical protein NDA13_000118 [Ustilago tritici]